jgi:hypothetical protein
MKEINWVIMKKLRFDDNMRQAYLCQCLVDAMVFRSSVHAQDRLWKWNWCDVVAPMLSELLEKWPWRMIGFEDKYRRKSDKLSLVQKKSELSTDDGIPWWNQPILWGRTNQEFIVVEERKVHSLKTVYNIYARRPFSFAMAQKQILYWHIRNKHVMDLILWFIMDLIRSK